MLTGAFSPSGARSAGQEAIAEASDAHDSRIARFSASERDGCVTTSLGCSKTQERLKIEDVVGRGRRPHVFLHLKTGEAAARHNRAGLPQAYSLKPPWLRACAGCPVLRR
jgi:hypothetical protein